MRNSRSLPAFPVAQYKPRQTPMISFCISHQFRDPGARQLHHLRHLRIVERRVLRRGLHFDELARAGHHHVHVDVGLRILFVAEVEHRHAADEAHAGGRDVFAQRVVS